jgi:hypothetical protein
VSTGRPPGAQLRQSGQRVPRPTPSAARDLPRPRQALLLALAAACLLGVAGCGAAKKPSAASSPRAAARWRGGLDAWNHAMLHALDEISVLLSTQQAVESLAEPHSKLRAELEPFEHTLAGCSATVRRLGPEPAGLPAARGYALAACAELERGEAFVAAALSGPAGGALGELARATAPLSAGQEDLAVAIRALVRGYAPPSGGG